MDKLYEVFINLVKQVKIDFKRFLIDEIDWSSRLIIITGARGAGKTTLLLQYIKENYKIDNTVLYVSLDNLYFFENTLTSLIDQFYKNGGKYIFLDEIHKYKNWSVEIKNAYDNYPELKIVATGSSALNIFKGFADLSRRVNHYKLPGLSFREYLNLTKKISFESYTLDNILKYHLEIAGEITDKIKPIAELNNYYQYGYYPYFLESKRHYLTKLLQTINVTIESDLPATVRIDYSNIIVLKKLLSLISSSVPFQTNITDLSRKIEISRNSIVQYFDYLSKGELIISLYKSGKNIGLLTKPEKIYLNNTNLIYALANENANIGTIRETFFVNQLHSFYTINSSDKGDFLVNNEYIFEVGGKSKNDNQIKNIENAYIVSDNLEIGANNKLPLWLFGFLY